MHCRVASKQDHLAERLALAQGQVAAEGSTVLRHGCEVDQEPAAQHTSTGI